jgi:serine protease Do
MIKPQGALVSKVLDDSPAKLGGIETGDVIINFAGTVIERSSDLPPMVGTTQVGDKIPVDVIRNGKPRRLTVEIGTLPEEEAALAESAEPQKTKLDTKLKLGVSELNKLQREQLQVEQGGVLIDDIADGPAYAAGLRVGDVILQINNQKVSGLEQFRELVGALDAGKSVPVLIQRQGGPLFLAMKIPAKS